MTMLPRHVSRLSIVRRALAAAALAGAAASPPANAAIVMEACARKAEAICTLAELYRGVTVFVDETAFGKWQFVDSDDALSEVQPNRVNVRFSESGRQIRLSFTSEQLFSHEIEGNYQFRYEVQTKAGAPGDRIGKFDLNLVDYDIFGSGNADLRVGAGFAEDVPLTPTWTVGTSQRNGVQDETLFASSTFAPLDTFVLSTRISMSGSPGAEDADPPGAAISLHEFSESFFRVPEPGTLSLCLLAIGLALPRSRRQLFPPQVSHR